MEIREYDVVLLKDGRTCTITYKINDSSFMAQYEPEDDEIAEIEISKNQIKKILFHI